MRQLGHAGVPLRAGQSSSNAKRSLVASRLRRYLRLRLANTRGLVLVHGARADAITWQQVVPGLSEHFQVLTYDRRGHSRSEGSEQQGGVDEDGDDLAALDLVPAHAQRFGDRPPVRFEA